jgi:Putative beta-barrel porin 2
MNWRTVCLCLVGFAGHIELRAADLSGQIATGLIETDNVQRTATNTMSDTIGEVLADFTLHEQTRRTDADVISNLQYLTYEHGIYSNQVIGNLAGSGKYAFAPGRFEWAVQDNFGQQQLNPGTPITPLNLENINYFSTGPNLLLTLSPSLQAQLEARYSRVSYQTSDLDSNQSDASAALVHPLSATSNVSIHAESERVRYVDSVANPDFTTDQGYLRYDAQGARSKLSVDVGYDEVTGLASRGGGALVKVEVAHIVSASSRLELSGGQDIADNGELLRQLQTLNGVAVSGGSLQRSNDPFVNRYASVAWKFDRNRTGFSVDVQRFQERHFDNRGLDQERTQADVAVRRNLTPQMTAQLGASYAKAAFNTTADGYRDLTATAALEWRIQRRLDLRAEYDHFDHSGEVTTNTFVENRIAVTVGMRLGSVQ